MAVGFFVFGSQSHAAALGVTSITTTLRADSITAGNTDFDSATLNGFVAGGGGGTVTYTVYSDDTCSTSVGNGGTGNVDPVSGAVPNSNPLSFNTAGTYYWDAAYSGDATPLPLRSGLGQALSTSVSTTRRPM